MHGRVELLCVCQGMRGAGVGEDEEVQEEEGVAVVAAGADKVVQVVQVVRVARVVQEGDKVVQVAQVEDKPMCRRQIIVNSCESQRFE